jgi:hypothetical protein
MTTTTRSSSPQIDEIETALQLLQAGIPLTLLLDLATPIHSSEVFLAEPGVADWLTAVPA